MRWIINGEDTEKTESKKIFIFIKIKIKEFYGVPEEVVLRSLNIL